jgi:pimeloyl-ACP methyl ester carboxylesterase
MIIPLLPMSVHTEELGDDTQRTIIMIHGAGGSTATWFMQHRGLSDSLYVVALDLNGHGRTQDRSDENLVESYLKDIDSVVSQFEKPILAGHSMGGALAQLYALRNPDKLSGLVLVATGAKLRVADMVFDLLDTDFEGYLGAVEEFMFHKNTSRDLIEASVVEVRKCPVRVIRRDYEMCNAFNVMDRLKEMQIPTLIIVGAQDMMTPVKYSQYLHGQLKKSKLLVIENAGHSVMLEQSSKVNQGILSWASNL